MDPNSLEYDRKLNLLMKDYFEWNFSTGQTAEQIVSCYENLISSLDTCEILMNESKQVQVANGKVPKIPKEIKINVNLSQIRETIEAKREEIIKTKNIVFQKQKCKATYLSSRYPNQKETVAKLQHLQKKITVLAKKYQGNKPKFIRRYVDLDLLLDEASHLEEELKRNRQLIDILHKITDENFASKDDPKCFPIQ
ncbi:hypothetical protein JTE90_017059 [Oedothorax gibbosus]|uniref:Uncharacterized protein n=1 Tax=Oedothorax gibbosus TaxID=931172 RepID=A0AAV6UN27_9ARAC|nr:hypothetical protein JTE90_017059 [Oedothorax gibbosus]